MNPKSVRNPLTSKSLVLLLGAEVMLLDYSSFMITKSCQLRISNEMNGSRVCETLGNHECKRLRERERKVIEHGKESQGKYKDPHSSILQGRASLVVCCQQN